MRIPNRSVGIKLDFSSHAIEVSRKRRSFTRIYKFWISDDDSFALQIGKIFLKLIIVSASVNVAYKTIKLYRREVHGYFVNYVSNLNCRASDNIDLCALEFGLIFLYYYVVHRWISCARILTNRENSSSIHLNIRMHRHLQKSVTMKRVNSFFMFLLSLVRSMCFFSDCTHSSFWNGKSSVHRRGLNFGQPWMRRVGKGRRERCSKGFKGFA